MSASGSATAQQALGERGPAFQLCRVETIDAETWTHVLHPVGFVALIASAEVDEVDVVHINHVLEQGSRQRCASGKWLMALKMGEFMDVSN